MTFTEALEQWNKGQKLTRACWGNPEDIVELDGAVFMRTAGEARFPCVFFSYEILATDWEIV